ncbi:MAG: flippase [Candidatus Competibacteraceae bacterium]|nr:flippase [Candidatus Competibacteraceae bacterium]
MNFLQKNILWILFDRMGRLLISFITGIIVARQLAPELYGIFTFSNAVVSIVSFLNIGAIEAIVIWQLVREPEAKKEILGSAFVLRLLGGIATVLTVICIVPFLEREPSIIAIVAPIIAGTTLFTAMDVGEYWLRQVLASKYGVIARQIALIIGAGGRIWAASSPSPLLFLALVIALEALLVAVGLAFSLHRLGVTPWHWRVVGTRCIQLLVGAWPLLLAAAAVGLYARAGVIILGQWQGSYAVGLFSVATIMVEATHAVPVAIMASVTPILLAQRLTSEAKFTWAFKIWLQRIVWLGIAVCLTLFLSAPLMMSLLFGSRYDGSIAIFEILIWSAFFVFISVASEVWLIGYNLQRYQLPKTLLAAVVSVMLNLCLAPTLGAKGTAIATLLSYSVSAFWANALFYDTRPLFRLQVMAFVPFKFWPLMQGSR